MPNEPSPAMVPQSLKGTAEALSIVWPDGLVHQLSWRLLRDRCPCATCRTKLTDAPQPTSLLPVLSLYEAQPVRVTRMRPIGNYAYAIEFNDGHNSGIYTLDFLRRLGEEQGASTL